MGDRLKRLRDELAARHAEAKENPPPPEIDHSQPIKISLRLKPYIDKIAADRADAQKRESGGDDV